VYYLFGGVVFSPLCRRRLPGQVRERKFLWVAVSTLLASEGVISFLKAPLLHPLPCAVRGRASLESCLRELCSVVALVLPTQMLVLPLLLASSLLDRPRSPTSRLAPPRAVTAECVMPSRGCFAVWASAAASVAFLVSSSPRPHLLS
jgi:hypothetical protein